MHSRSVPPGCTIWLPFLPSPLPQHFHDLAALETSLPGAGVANLHVKAAETETGLTMLYQVCTAALRAWSCSLDLLLVATILSLVSLSVPAILPALPG